ncbi:PHM [Mytilus edulis]|uniref:peptidylglycine monooxygenase n=1 Tax=Mytilus edulis TaxID=6550 RepID=A0A8S3R3X4_MYTED|nr:PHM [Mytilus edulis]
MNPEDTSIVEIDYEVKMSLLKAISLFLAVCIVNASKLDLLMPEVAPDKADTYLCIPLKMSELNTYIVGFEPHANKKVAHHMLLYGCDTPGIPGAKVWNCGGMEHPSFKSAGTCKTGNKGIIYAWAYDAPGLTLPKDNGVDSSGVSLITTEVPQPKRAGVMLLGTGGMLPKHSVEYFETACKYRESFTVYPFAYRTHAHKHGKVVSGYVIKDGVWTELGRKDPMKPEMFYNVTTTGVRINPGDYMAARCTMKNDEDRNVYIGATSKDEMCNFYIMFYTDGTKTTSQNCWTAGPPSFYWDESTQYAKAIHPENAPENISTEPESGKSYKITTRKMLL